MEEPRIQDVLRELHSDLARKYKKHGAKLEEAWRSFDRNQRAKCIKAGAADGVVLKHSLDYSLGNVYKFIPEWNLRDLTNENSDLLLDILKYRATSSLYEQFAEGVNGGEGDRDLIQRMVDTKGLRHVEDFKNCYTFFMDEEYGKSFRIMRDVPETLAGFAPAIQAGVCLPQSTGELILQRQVTLMQSLNIIIEDILEEGSRTRNRNERPKKNDDPASAAISKLSLKDGPPPAKLSLSSLVDIARDQRDALEDNLALLSTEPTVLAHAVNLAFFSRPELVADEKGRRLPAHTDKYISGAFFDAVHNAVKGTAIWSYICRLLELLENHGSDKTYRAILLQEISNVCHLEYTRAQSLFKRQVQTCGDGAKWFKRMSNAYDNVGNARVALKGNPDELTRSDPRLHYMLRLCQPETTAPKAVDWIKKLSDLHEAHPMEREKLEEREADALADLIVITSFIQDLSPVISMPSLSRKKGQMFVSRSQGLEAELNKLKNEIDLRDFVVPIDNLLEPGMADGALKALDQFVIEKAGTKLGFLYQDLVQDCLNDVCNQYEIVKAKLEKKDEPPVPLLAVSTPEPVLEKRVEQRKQKEKTRPSPSSVYEITASATGKPSQDAQHKLETTTPVPQTFNVGSATAQVFSRLFTKSEARGSVNWTAFEAAMADLGFSVTPKYGSVYTFSPPESMSIKKPITVHRPHKSRIEGYHIPIFARRLERTYGWGNETFVSA